MRFQFHLLNYQMCQALIKWFIYFLLQNCLDLLLQLLSILVYCTTKLPLIWCVLMYLCMCVCVGVGVCMWTCVCVHVYACVNEWVCMAQCHLRGASPGFCQHWLAVPNQCQGTQWVSMTAWRQLVTSILCVCVCVCIEWIKPQICDWLCKRGSYSFSKFPTLVIHISSDI